MDEQNHIARGLAFLRTGDPRLSLEHPPLINTLSAVPLLTMPSLRLPTDHPSWDRPEGWYEFADLFLWEYNHEVDRIVFLARIPVVFLLIALGLTGYRFARSLWGKPAAVIALGFILFEPNLMAHGRYATTDIGGTLWTFLTTYSLWQLWQRSGRWDWKWWALSSLTMGLAFGSKLSALGFIAIWFVLALLPLYPNRGGEDKRPAGHSMLMRLGQLATAILISFLVVWAIFGFEWGADKFTGSRLTQAVNWPLPMPTYWAGIEQIISLSGQGRMQTFLLGRFSNDGFMSYFPVAFLVKTPLILLLLLLPATFMLLRNQRTRNRAIYLIVPVVLFYMLTMTSSLNIGYRHALPALPYLLVLVSGLTANELRVGPAVGSESLQLNVPFLASLIGLGLVVLTALYIHPHYLSFFNLAAGGPSNGYRVLTDSNVDWGQDLIRLGVWMDENDVEKVKLGWFGSADPNYYGINHEPLPGIGRDRYFRLWWDVPFDRFHPEPGVYAISASSIWEIPLRVEEKSVYAWFREREPDDRVGYSILIYEVP